ncbi:TonB-dependent receptor [Roseateles sp. BYS96W]|uniref:TonB-dependent receptor n=1 Tax=Pelomonas nitida TaxID=3299027 RepID=A0ABW7G1F1_9BURK
MPAIVIRGRNSDGKLPGGQVARGARLGLLSDKDVMDTPFSVISYTSQTIADQQAPTAADVIGNSPAVRVSVSPGGLLDAFYIRGFPVNEGNLGEFGFDGVYGVAPNYRVFADYLERVELVRGPTALLNGMAPNGGIGGSVNVVPKRAGSADVTQLGLEYGSPSQPGARVDLSRRFGEQREFGVRFNGSLRDGDTPVDKQTREAHVGALSLDYAGHQLRATLDLLSQHERFDAPSRPVFLGSATAVPAIPSAPDGTRNVTQSWEWSKVDDQSALLRAEYDLNDSVTMFANLGGARTEVDRLFGNPVLSNTAGDVTWTPARFKLDIHRATADAGARLNLRTGGVDHAISLQASQYRDRLSRGQANGTAVTSNLYEPVDRAGQAPADPSLAKISDSELSGIALSDTLSMLDRTLQLSLGARVQQVQSRNFNAAGAVSQDYDKRATTPFLGVVVKPLGATLSLYGNYIEGLSKGDSAPASAANAGEVLAPYKAKQYELGAKYQLGHVTTTVAAFQITKPSGMLNASNVYTADGEQRNRGIELEAFGELTPSVRLLSGLALLDAKITQSSTTAFVGKQPIGVPELQANLGAEWDTAWARGLTLTTQLAYAGKQYADGANLRSIPAWTRLDAGARWRTDLAGKATTLRANVRNLFNKDYWSGVSSFGGLAQGSPRTLQLSAVVDF